MTLMEKAAHAAERKAFEKVLENFIQKGKTADAASAAQDLVDMAEKIQGSVWKKESFEVLHMIAGQPEGKWAHYVQRILDETDPYILKTFLTNAVYEGGFRGYQQAQKNAEKYGCNIPWAILMDPTSACNLHCTGCWAAEYGNKLNLSYEELDDIINQANELGTYMFLYTGGEPMVRKNDLLRLCEAHPDCVFSAFTNGTLIDEKFADEMLRVKNFYPAISIEGFEEATDFRRGKGTYQATMRAMKILKEKKLPFGVSGCYTSKNIDSISSDEFFDHLVECGAKFAWFFHYMPVGNDSAVELLPSPDQREKMYNRICEYRSTKPIFTIDFQNDAKFVNGCIAGGRNYLHINANGDIEPCAFIHYSDSNIREKTLLEAYQSPLFMAYHDGQPFNDNMFQPCPMLENPECLRSMVKKSGAHSTEYQSPESVDHLCDKTTLYAETWKPKADELWAACQGCSGCKK